MDEVLRSHGRSETEPVAGPDNDTETSIDDYFLREWPRDEAGYYHRQAARVVAFNSHDDAVICAT